MKFEVIWSFLLLTILLYGCSNGHENLNFEGHWYVVGHPTNGYTHWKISDKNIVQAHHKEPELIGHFQIVRGDDGHFILESEDFYHSPEIGKIINWDDDTIEFSSGLKMIQLAGETESPFSIKEFNEILSTSIWRYELAGNKTTLYLSDSLNVFGFQSTDIIKTGDWNYTDQSISWSLESYNGNFVFSHKVDVSEIVTILLDKVKDHEFSGRLLYNGEVFPVNVQHVSPASSNQIDSITSVLTGTEWKAVNVRNLNTQEANNIYLYWNGAINFKSLETDDLSKVVFTFSFKPDQTAQLYLDEKLLENYFWKISKDAKYLFVYKHRPGQKYIAELDDLYKIPPALSIEMDYFLSSEDLILPTDYLIFEMIAQ